MNIKDGLVAITNEVLGETLKQAEATIAKAENQAKENMRAAKEQADKNYQAIIDESKAKGENEKRKIASRTEVEIRNILLVAKEHLVDSAFLSAQTKLSDYAKTDQYKDYLLRQIEKVSKRIGQKKLILQVNAQDKRWLNQKTLNRLSKQSGYDLKLSSESGDFIGGCKIQTADSKIVYDSTLNSRLEELKPTLRIKVAKILFSGGTDDR